MTFIAGENRYQTTISIECLDDSIDQNNSVRVIDAFVNILDIKRLGFVTHEEIKPGQNPYNRKDLLKLHIYGYMNGIRSSRKLEAETKRNLEIIWLISKLTPDHGTISAFIKDNKKAFRQVLKEFSLMLKGWGLVDGKLIAIDGTKLKANNSKKNYVTVEILNKKIQYIGTQIDECMTLLESNDQSIHTTMEKTEEIIAKIALYKSKKDHFEILQKSMNSQGIKQLSFTDPDSRGM
jgi:transposase